MRNRVYGFCVVSEGFRPAHRKIDTVVGEPAMEGLS